MLEELMKQKDGHIHTCFCPHANNDSLEQYIEVRMAKGIKEMSFTEHLPLPEGVLSPEDTRACALVDEEVIPYFRAVESVREKYKGQIKINKGLEVDYIEGQEAYTKAQLNKYGEELEDGLLSVHILKVKEGYYSVDLLEDFEKLEGFVGSREGVYNLYFETLLKSIRADLGDYKPKRIGHPTLVRIFNQKYPLDYNNEELLEEVVKAIKEGGYEIDFNAAGLRRPYCKEIYPSGKFFELICKYGVKYVYGSDAHGAEQL